MIASAACAMSSRTGSGGTRAPRPVDWEKSAPSPYSGSAPPPWRRSTPTCPGSPSGDSTSWAPRPLAPPAPWRGTAAPRSPRTCTTPQWTGGASPRSRPAAPRETPSSSKPSPSFRRIRSPRRPPSSPTRSWEHSWPISWARCGRTRWSQRCFWPETAEWSCTGPHGMRWRGGWCYGRAGSPPPSHRCRHHPSWQPTRPWPSRPLRRAWPSRS
mmetsp:Transcript_15654/g.49153  ORF Transcript_15654/g.49153 Transcript_15654/m.49153 type:complete len:213 (+) Transcript_15654:1966-2604(+)